MAQLPAIPVHRLHKVVVEELEKRILSGDFRDGEKLPSEAQMAEQLGVGRRVVREALKVLQTKRLVEVRMGSGAFVKRNDLDEYLNSLSSNVRSYLENRRAEVRHIQEFRELIEGEAVRRLAERRQPEVLEQLEDALNLQKKGFEEREGQLYNRGHFLMHKTIVDSLDNPITSMLYSQVLRLVQARMMAKAQELSVMQRSIEEHRDLLNALAAGDVAASEAILAEHLDRFRSNIDNGDEEQD